MESSRYEYIAQVLSEMKIKAIVCECSKCRLTKECVFELIRCDVNREGVYMPRSNSGIYICKSCACF